MNFLVELANEFDIFDGIGEDERSAVVEVEEAFEIDVEPVLVLDDSGEGEEVFRDEIHVPHEMIR